MRRRIIVTAVATLAMSLVGAARAGEFGTADEARAMLDRVVAAVKKDKAAALEMITKGTDGFKDRDLYPFCGGPDGIATAHPTQVGTSFIGLKDKTGYPFGAEMYKVAQEGKIAEVKYMWPRPGETEPVEKIGFVTKVDDQVCGVGYYK